MLITVTALLTTTLAVGGGTVMAEYTLSAEHRAKISAGNLGKRRSEETKQKLSDYRKQCWKNQEYRERAQAYLVKAREHLKESGAPTPTFAGHRHHPDTKARQAAFMRALRASETIEQSRRRNPGRSHSQETRAKLSATHIGMKHTPEARAKMSASMKGRIISPEQRAKLSAIFKGRPAQYPNKRTYYKGVAFRSSWEVRAAAAFDALGVPWEYESQRFDLGTQTWAPDFYLPEAGAYWEVKGYYGPQSQRTVELFRERHPEIPLVLLTETGLRLLEQAARRKAAA